MPTNAIIAYGATVERSVNGSTWNPIPECKGVAIPDRTQDYKDVTSLDSPGRAREFIKGLIDNGTIALPCNYTSSGYAQQLSDEAATGPIYYRVTLVKNPAQSSVGDRFTFRGFPSPQIGNTGAVDDPLMMTVNIRITGDVTFTAGS